MKFDTIHHVALICSDYKASRHFYVDLLGFEIIRENYRENRGDYKLDLKLGDCELELFAIPGSLRVKASGLPGRLHRRYDPGAAGAWNRNGTCAN